MATLIYALCALTSAACAASLLVSNWRVRHRLLFWSGLCFVALTVSNVLLVLDALLPEIDFGMARLWTALAAVCLLLYGLVFEE